MFLCQDCAQNHSLSNIDNLKTEKTEIIKVDENNEDSNKEKFKENNMEEKIEKEDDETKEKDINTILQQDDKNINHKDVKKEDENKKYINHEIINVYRLRYNACYKHNEILTRYCYNCDEKICVICLENHRTHYIEKLDKKDKTEKDEIKKFEVFIEKSEIFKNNNYDILNTNIIWMQNHNKNDKESLNELNNSISKMLSIFYKELKIEQNLIFFAKMLFSTYILFKEKEENITNYKTILNQISQYFEKVKLEEFNKLIITEKDKFMAFVNRLTKEESEILQETIKKIFSPDIKNNSDFDKKKNFIKDNIEYSSMIKRYITQEKLYHPENYIDIDSTIYDENVMCNNLNFCENQDFVLSLLGKSIENNGTKINISKKKDENFKEIEIASIQSIFTLGTKNKFELHFDFGENENEKILNNPEEKEKFLNKYKEEIAKELKINVENLIFTDVHSGSVGVHASIINSNGIGLKEMKKLEQKDYIKKIEEKPLLEALQISGDVLDPRGDRHDNWGINEKRGGEEYIPPLNGWYGIGLKVWGKYDNGDNAWLDYNNQKGEYAIAYLGLNNHLNSKEEIVKDLNNFTQDIKYMIMNNSLENEIDYRNNSFFTKIFGNPTKCGEGIPVYKNPDFAENSAAIIDIPECGYRIKIILMCRVNPAKIRQPQNYPDIWILNPTPDEIRPYRVLIKKIPITPLAGAANNSIITTPKPIDYIINDINSNDFSFYNLAEKPQFKKYSFKNGKKLSNDEFVLKLYSSDYYIIINNYLRSQTIDKLSIFTEDEIKSWVCCLQLALKRKTGVKDNTVVYRGIKHFKFPQEMGIGSKFYMREFFSTSIDKKVALRFAKEDKEGTIMVITIKNNGTNNHFNYCFYVEDISDFPNEKEILISSHCYFGITKIERNKEFDYVYMTCEGYLLN